MTTIEASEAKNELMSSLGATARGKLTEKLPAVSDLIESTTSAVAAERSTKRPKWLDEKVPEMFCYLYAECVSDGGGLDAGYEIKVTLSEYKALALHLAALRGYKEAA